MSVGPRDVIDKRLVQIYSNVQTSNFDITSKIDPEQIMDMISIIGLNNKAFIQIKKNHIPKIA